MCRGGKAAAGKAVARALGLAAGERGSQPRPGPGCCPGPGRVRVTIEIRPPTPTPTPRPKPFQTGRLERKGIEKMGRSGKERERGERANTQVNSPPGTQRAFSGLVSQPWKNLLRNPQMTGCNFLCANLQPPTPTHTLKKTFFFLVTFIAADFLAVKYILCIL